MLNKLTYWQNPNTISLAVITASLLFPLSGTASGDLTSSQNTDYLTDPPYVQRNNISTFGCYDNQLMSEFKTSDEVFEQKVTKFYSHLLAGQESLGIEFEKVLHESLWDLYES